MIALLKAAGATPGLISVVAGENFWGSIASQLAGSHGKVQSVVTDPNADPHEYASSTSDGRAFADANIVILNGAGYDDWGKKLLGRQPRQQSEGSDGGGPVGQEGRRQRPFLV